MSELTDRLNRMLAAEREAARSADARQGDQAARVNRHHANFLSTWWRLSYRRDELMTRLESLPRYIVCGRVTKRPVFEFVAPSIHPNDALVVFPFADDYSFGILQSSLHWEWFVARCSTLKGDFRYTSNTVFDTFAWPQQPSIARVEAVAAAAVNLRSVRRSLMIKHKLSLRELYRSLEQPGQHPLKSVQEELDLAVRAAYGFSPKADILGSLLKLNTAIANAEGAGTPVTGPGLPSTVKTRLVTSDCLRMP